MLKTLELTVFIILGFLPSLSVFFVNRNMEWYKALKKPIFTPPDWVFSAIWPILFVILGLAGHVAWKQRQKREGLIYLQIFFLNTGLLILWNFLFFQQQNLALSTGLLLIIVIAGFFKFWLLMRMFPKFVKYFTVYLIWINFAFVLNLSLLFLNR
ncbi:MAG: tryptophan-rich sensory protein [Deltaproteobacteria bacterium]|nr:tryptophan-rich sensory protein [Deltaproteobacteria bacterium]